MARRLHTLSLPVNISSGGRAGVGREAPVYEKIYVPLDNSDHSNAAIEVAIALARGTGARLVGSHVYAARMHDVRFKQMEYTLPEEYQHEQELERQRKIHDSLITRGLQLISDSYLDVMKAACDRAGLPFEYKTVDGKNWECLVDDISESDYDVVVMGALGMGAVKDSMVGSVTDRVVRRIRVDTLVIKDTHPFREDASERIVVAIDGSPQSFAGLQTGIALARVLGKQVEAVSVYDPYLHYAMFNGIVDVLSAEASKIFRFKEQEQLHEEIIDTGLAKIYESHLRVAQSVARDEGIEIKTTLLDGKAFKKVLRYVRQDRPRSRAPSAPTRAPRAGSAGAAGVLPGWRNRRRARSARAPAFSRLTRRRWWRWRPGRAASRKRKPSTASRSSGRQRPRRSSTAFRRATSGAGSRPASKRSPGCSGFPASPETLPTRTWTRPMDRWPRSSATRYRR